MSQALALQPTARTMAHCSVSARRLLIPVKDTNDASRGISYAIRRRAEGEDVSVCLLHVEESPTQWQTLFGGGSMLAARRRRTEDAFAGVLELLQGLDIEFAAYVRAGPTVFSILDAAEELGCDEIVVPEPVGGMFRLLSRDIVSTLLARQRAIPVVLVSKHGVAVS
jgi:nucleotide-binding universal stress UspA family protein